MEDNPFILGSSTFGGNPLCCAGAIAGIHTIFAENIPEQAREKGDYILRALRQMREQFPQLLRDVRGMGLLLGMEFVDNARGFSVAKRLFERRVLVGGTLNNATVIRIEPPAVIRYDQIDTVLQALEDSLREEARLL
jgi:putrescine aminotransferase